MSGSLVADLGLGPRTWLFITFLSCIALFFKFHRIWSIRNIDLMLLFAPAPGLLALVGAGAAHSWFAYVWLLVGTVLILFRCLFDLGLTRRPLLEPNLNAAGLICLMTGVLGLLLAETIQLPRQMGMARNPADPGEKADPQGLSRRSSKTTSDLPARVLKAAPLPSSLRRSTPQVILSRVLAMTAHLALIAGLIVICRRHFDRPIAGLACATCYMILPYTRIAIVDSGQLISSALIVGAFVFYQRPMIAGLLLGLAGGWIPACLGLLPLWARFYWNRGMRAFLIVAIAVVLGCVAISRIVPDIAVWARALGARNLTEAGLRITLGRVELHQIVGSPSGSFWTEIDPSYRLPVLIAYIAFVVLTVFLPARKELGEMIALSASLLVASQFWYLDAGGTLVMLYLPLVLLLVFRPHLIPKRPIPISSRTQSNKLVLAESR